MSDAQYAIAGVGVAGMMVAGWMPDTLLVQVGKYYVPGVAGIGMAGLMVAGYTGQGAALKIIEQSGFKVEDAGLSVVPTATFTIICQTDQAPHDGDPVIVAIGTLRNRIFGGYLSKISLAKWSPTRVQYDCEAQGWTRDLEKRQIDDTFTACYAGTILQSLFATYTSQFDTTAGMVEDGAYIENFQCQHRSLLECCNDLASRSGFVFSIDPMRQAHFRRAEVLSAPFDIISGASLGALKITPDSSGLVNRVTVLFSELRQKTQSFIGDGTTKDFTLDYVPYETEALTVNGVAVTFGTHFAEDNSEKDFSIDYTRGIINTRNHAILTGSDTLTITYVAKFPAKLVRNHAASQLARQNVDGGDGIYDLLIKDDKIVSLADARALADAELNQYAWPRVSATYERGDAMFDLTTNRLRVGMLQRLNYWEYDEYLTIEKVTLSVLNSMNDYRLYFSQSVALGAQAATLTDAIKDTTTSAVVAAEAYVEYEETL